MPEHDRNNSPVYSEWIPRQAVTDDGLDCSKLQVVPADVASAETWVDAAGGSWVRLRGLDETGSDYFLFRLL